MGRALKFEGCTGQELCYTLQRDLSAAELPVELRLSKRQTQRLRDEKRLLVEGVVPQGGTLMAGTSVSLYLAKPCLEPSVELATPVIAHDQVLLAADKPADLLVHSDGTGAQTLTDRVVGALRAAGSDTVPQALQRLDVPTSGLVLFSLTEEFQPAFDAMIADGEVEKRYLAVVQGELDRELTITAPLGRDRHQAQRMRVSPTGKAAVTQVVPLVTRGRYTLLLVQIKTGRRHQIRVHLASQGYPLVGDTLYGGQTSEVGLGLHAWRSSGMHPVTDALFCFESPFPERFSAWGFSTRDIEGLTNT